MYQNTALQQALNYDYDALVVISGNLEVLYFNKTFVKFSHFFFKESFNENHFYEIGSNLHQSVYKFWTQSLDHVRKEGDWITTLHKKDRYFKFKLSENHGIFFGKIRDVTQNYRRQEIAKRQHLQIKEREEKFRTIFQAMPLAFMFAQISDKGEIVSVNRAFENFIGYNEKKMDSTKRIYDFVEKSYHLTLRQFLFEKKNASTSLEHIEVQIIDAHGLFHFVNLHIKYERHQNVDYFMLFLQNISDVKRKNQELMRQLKRIKDIRLALARAMIVLLTTGFAIIQSVLIYIERNETDHIINNLLQLNHEFYIETEFLNTWNYGDYQNYRRNYKLYMDSLKNKVIERQNKWYYIDVHKMYYPNGHHKKE